MGLSLDDLPDDWLDKKKQRNLKANIWMCTKCYDVIFHPQCFECDLPAWTLGQTLKYMMEHTSWLQDNVFTTVPIKSHKIQD